MIRLASEEDEPDRRTSDATQEAAPRRRGVLLTNVGTPDAPDVASVRRYLAEFLGDPLVIQLPAGLRWLQRPLARLIARRRAPRSAAKYRLIWTERGSPLRTIMERQAAALAGKLPAGWRVYLGMRYGSPGIAETLQRIAAEGIEELVVVPLYPQFSQTTTGTVVQEVYRALKQAGPHLNVTARTTWYDDGGYINAQAHLLHDYAAAHGLAPHNTFLLFSAHGLPTAYVRRGDPYARQVHHTVRLVTERLGWPKDRTGLAYQSRMGPAEWLEPHARDALIELAEADERRVLVCPISFSVDCLETLEEIDVRYRADFEARGGQLFLCPALDTYDRFMTALKNLVVRGPRPVSKWGPTHRPLIAGGDRGEPRGSGLDTLVMVGASLESRIGPGRGPRLAYSAPAGLACAKRPHAEVHALLKSLCGRGLAREALLWNTCHRFECYAWLDPAAVADERDCLVARLKQELFGRERAGLRVNVLFGVQAWHHLARTAAGLNSGLPGDTDVVEQLQAAGQLAERAGTAGSHAQALIEEAVGLARQMRAETTWGRRAPGYCRAALSRIKESLPLRLANCRHVVIGGSATSRSILHALFNHFDVKESAATLVYRNHQGGQMKQLRKAIGRGRRLRAHSYADRAVLAAIADADVVYFGIDRDEPVLSAGALRALRDFNERPLFIVDFNSAGSTEGLAALPGVTLWQAEELDAEVAAYADAMCADEAFPRSVQEVEAWLADRAPGRVAVRLRLPCRAPGETDHPACTRCEEMLEPATIGSGAS